MDAIISAKKISSIITSRALLRGISGWQERSMCKAKMSCTWMIWPDEIIIHYLKTTRRVIHAVSEECDEIIKLNEDGRYFMYFDPLDGSSNVAHGLPVGFLFGIAKRNLKGVEDFHLRAGREYIAAGMFVIPTGTLTIALRDAGAWRFHIDETQNYVKPMQVILPDDPEKLGAFLQCDEPVHVRRQVQDCVQNNERNYTFRYMGALAGDFHRILTNGGMFMYPAIVNHPDPKKNRPEGKLRLMYEASVVAFMCCEAGGHAVNEDGIPILDIKPASHHQRTALYVGSKSLVDDITKALKA